MYGYNEAIAIRWQEIPNETAGEENEAVKNKHQDELKNEWFAKMSHHSDKCIKSVTREMMQKMEVGKVLVVVLFSFVHLMRRCQHR